MARIIATLIVAVAAYLVSWEWKQRYDCSNFQLDQVCINVLADHTR